MYLVTRTLSRGAARDPIGSCCLFWNIIDVNWAVPSVLWALAAFLGSRLVEPAGSHAALPVAPL